MSYGSGRIGRQCLRMRVKQRVLISGWTSGPFMYLFAAQGEIGGKSPERLIVNRYCTLSLTDLVPVIILWNKDTTSVYKGFRCCCECL